MVSGVETAADRDQTTCVWRLRDRYGWREGIVVSGSADLLTAWHAARMGMSPRSRAAIDQRFGALIDKVRQARLADNLDALESACQTLLHHSTDRPVPPRLRQAWIDLREMLSRITPSAQGCLFGHDCACTSPPGERDRDEHR
jgi:hypothetical protein